MKLAQYIRENGGTKKFADRMEVTTSCVRYWMREAVKPRRPVANAIVRATDGQVTLQDIYGEDAA